jgi:hypothetical protein
MYGVIFLILSRLYRGFKMYGANILVQITPSNPNS